MLPLTLRPLRALFVPNLCLIQRMPSTVFGTIVYNPHHVPVTLRQQVNWMQFRPHSATKRPPVLLEAVGVFQALAGGQEIFRRVLWVDGSVALAGWQSVNGTHSYPGSHFAMIGTNATGPGGWHVYRHQAEFS